MQKKRISRKERERIQLSAVQYLRDGGNYRRACEVFGVTRSTLKKWQQKFEGQNLPDLPARQGPGKEKIIVFPALKASAGGNID